MKTKTLSVIAMVLAVGLSAAVSRAGDESKSDTHPQGEFRHDKQHGPRGDRLQMMSEQLNLTEEQKAKLKPILAEQAEALKALRGDAAADRAERRSEARAVHEKYQAQIRGVLTPEQQQKLDELRKDRPGHGKRQARPQE